MATNNVIYTLVKLVKEREHAEAFRRGELFMNTLEYFRTLEGSDGQRGDEYEGIGALLQPAQLREIRLGDHSIPPADILGPIVMTPDTIGQARAFCMHAFHNHGIATVSRETIRDLKDALTMRPDCYRFGAIAAIVTHPCVFLSRVKTAIRGLNVEASLGLVEYFDDSLHHGALSEKPGFYKRKQFAHQCEYRILLGPFPPGFPTPVGPRDAYRLNVGDLSDIVHVTTTDEIARFSIALPDGTTA